MMLMMEQTEPTEVAAAPVVNRASAVEWERKSAAERRLASWGGRRLEPETPKRRVRWACAAGPVRESFSGLI